MHVCEENTTASSRQRHSSESFLSWALTQWSREASPHDPLNELIQLG